MLSVGLGSVLSVGVSYTMSLGSGGVGKNSSPGHNSSNKRRAYSEDSWTTVKMVRIKLLLFWAISIYIMIII